MCTDEYLLLKQYKIFLWMLTALCFMMNTYTMTTILHVRKRRRKRGFLFHMADIRSNKIMSFAFNFYFLSNDIGNLNNTNDVKHVLTQYFK